MIKATGLTTIKQIKLIIIFFILAFFSAIFLFATANKTQAAGYTFNGLSPGFQGANCAAVGSWEAQWWVAVRADLRDSVTGASIGGTFTAKCQYTSYDSALGRYWYGPRFGPRCAGGSAGSWGVVCMGSCTLPFHLSAKASGYYSSPVWLVNYAPNDPFDSHYPEGNRNTANYTIYLDKIPVAKPTNTLHVNSAGAAGVWISGSQAGTSGHTNYTVSTTNTIHTWLTAPSLVAGNTKKFHSWSGCASVSGYRCLTPVISGGATRTMTVRYVDNLGWIQGYKIRAPTLVRNPCVQNPAPDYPCSSFPPSHELVKLDDRSLTRANSYSTGGIMYGWHKVSVSAPAGWEVKHQSCVNGANCTGRIIGQAVWVNVPPGGYVDLWWYYHPLNLIVDPLIDVGEKHVGDDVVGVQITVKNTGVKSTPSFKVQFCRNGTAAYTCLGGWNTPWTIPSLGPGGTEVLYPQAFPAPDPGAGNYPTTYRMIARADLDIGTPGRVVEDIEIADNRSFGTYTVIGPPPWFHTRGGGDVGSYKEIEPKTAPTGIDYSSADYLVISDNAINSFTSARRWLVQDYHTGINLKPAPVGSSIYQAMFNKYTKQCLEEVNASTPGAIAGKISAAGCNILVNQGNLTINNDSWYPPPKGYTGLPAVVFVNGNMSIQRSMAVGADNGLIFVVRENITVGENVSRADGVYLFDGDYDVRSRNSNTEQQLLVKGVVIGAFNNGRFRLDRDFRSIRSEHEPTEIFEFQPKYLWLFRDFLGDVKTRFDEVAP